MMASFRLFLLCGLAGASAELVCDPTDNKQDCAALNTLYDATGGKLSTWAAAATGNASYCSWDYSTIRCDYDKESGTAVVDKLLLGAQRPVWKELEGEIDVSGFTKLTTLDASGNKFSVFPKLPTTLTYLDLDDNPLSGAIPAAEIGSLTDLIYLNLADSHLTGDVPNELCGLFSKGKLSYCDISSNAFSCPLPACVSKAGNCSGTCLRN